MLLTLKYNLHLLIAFQSLLFLFVLVFPPFNKFRHNVFLALFFLFQALSESNGLLKDVVRFNPITLTFSDVSPLVFFPSLPLNFMVIPFLYMYVLAVTDSNFKLKPLHCLHTLPFVGVIGFVISEYQSKGIIALIMISKYNDTLFIRQDYYNFRVLHLLQMFLYLFLCYRRLTLHKRHIAQVYSSFNEVNLKWLQAFLYALTVWGVFDVLTLIIYYKNYSHYPLSYIISYTVFLIIMAMVFIRSLSQREILLPDLLQGERKYGKNQLSGQERESYLKMLLEYIETERPYLNPDITIKDLSSGTGISSHTISQILNTGLNQNFYDFINSYRILESCRLLTEQAEESKTITEILFESGFNSKSTFNTAFKKHTGMTPSGYKEAQTHAHASAPAASPGSPVN